MLSKLKWPTYKLLKTNSARPSCKNPRDFISWTFTKTGSILKMYKMHSVWILWLHLNLSYSSLPSLSSSSGAANSAFTPLKWMHLPRWCDACCCCCLVDIKLGPWHNITVQWSPISHYNCNTNTVTLNTEHTLHWTRPLDWAQLLLSLRCCQLINKILHVFVRPSLLTPHVLLWVIEWIKKILHVSWSCPLNPMYCCTAMSDWVNMFNIECVNFNLKCLARQYY